MAFGDGDRAAMLADFGVTVIYAATTVKGIVDEVDEATLQGHVAPQLGRNKSVLVATGAISPAQGGTISVDGTNYTVHTVQEEPPDGRFVRVWLAS